VDSLVTHRCDVADAPAAYDLLVARGAERPLGIVLRYDGAQEPIVLAMRRIVHSIDAAVPAFDAQTIDEVLEKARLSDRFTTVLLTGFSLLALLLAALGTYGVVAYGVAERTREIGVRIALGARTQDVLRMILREGFTMFVVAIPIALGGVWAAARTLQGLLFGVNATDPSTVALSVAVVAVEAGVTCYVPARRAAGVDPTTAIRESDGP